MLGGRSQAEERLAGIDPLAYRATRNELTGAVTRLSPYIRHGVLTLSEVKAEVVRRGIKLRLGIQTAAGADLARLLPARLGRDR